MSYGSDQYMSSSYRKIFGESPRLASSSSRMSNASSRSSMSSSGFRSLSLTRSSASPAGYYKRSARSSSFSPVHFDSVDFSQTSVLNNEFKIIRTNEKEQLQGLNDRFATFIEKVRNLEQQNKVLETELVTLRQRQNEPSRLADLYQQEIRDLRAQLDEANSERAHVLIERDGIEEDLQKLRGNFEDEIRAREEAEQTLRTYKKDVDDATMVRVDLERRVESLLDEINFLRKVHDEEVAELTNMIQAAQISVEVEMSKPDLTSALKEIRGQYETLASKNLQSAEEWYKSKFASLNEQATKTNEVMRATKEEINDYRRQLQSKTIEIETLRGTNESLERQIREMEDAHNAEVAGYQETIGQLDLELRNTKSEMARHLREYQDLLNVKMALDIEIAAYRKLLEGEETHFSSGVTFSSTPSISYGYQSRPTFTSTRNPKKEKEEEGQTKSKAAAKRDENIEETTAKKAAEKSDVVDVNSK
ncbi:alpha-internexin-like [Xyrauchen texanus]|uniref:alpha-internexin-like n=1 Tax=Xyrauchen texanus TaxID=154827 RepID=UPI00224244EA|nr:alpha-internexin-like [Xyrauchen texanus]